MTIGYEVRPCALTNPQSYACHVSAAAILDIDDVAEQISMHNPNITAATAKTVLEAFQNEVRIQLLAGNTVKIKNFVSFVTTLSAKLTLPTDPLPAGNLNIVAKVSKTFQNTLRNEAEFERLGYPVKNPQITSCFETNLELQNYIEPGKPFKIQGTNIGFDASDPALGVFIKDAAGTVRQQTNIAENMPSSITIVPASPLVTNTAKPDVEVIIKTRYTENGQIKTGSFANQVRALCVGREIFSLAGGNAPLDYESSGLSTGDMTIFICSLRPDNLVELTAGIFGQPETVGPPTLLLEDGGEYIVKTGGATPIAITINTADLPLLKTNLLACGRHMQEVSQYVAA